MFRLPPPQPLDALLERHGARYKWLMLLVIGLGCVAGVLLTTSFNVAVPALVRHFQIGQDQVQWAMTGFMAAMAIAMLPTSWLLNRLGLRRLFLLALLLLALGSVAGFFAPNFPFLVFARVVQGAATGVFQPLAPLVVMRYFPLNQQGRASGALSLGIVLAPAVAPALGGLLLDAFGWQAIFLLPLPFLALAGILGLSLLPLPQQQTRPRFDWLGLTLLSVVTLAMVEGVSSLQHSGLASVWTWSQALVAALALAFFIRHGRKTRRPLISLGLFRHATFCLGSVVSFAYGFGLYASTYLIPVFLQNALHFSATAAGLTLLPAGIALALVIPLAGRMADRQSPKGVTIAGLALFCVSFLLFAGWSGAITLWEILVVTILGRLGLGLILPALNLATLRPLGAHQLAQSSVVV
ncbi:MAG: DHA2 family efflux MFS transporter permease subunit, partial [Zoogloeaceae bacterium]|nr:DHA2 family efflux MFS transporter permease subunit [Zoogloeaceae bacterium]